MGMAINRSYQAAEPRVSYAVSLCDCLDREWNVELLSALRFDQNARILNSSAEACPASGRHDSPPGAPRRRTLGPETRMTLLCQTTVTDWALSFARPSEANGALQVRLVLSGHVFSVEIESHDAQKMFLLGNTHSATRSCFRSDILLSPKIHKVLRLAGINPIRLFLLREASVFAVAMQTAPVGFVANVSNLYVDYDGTLVNHYGPIVELLQALRISQERHCWDLYIVTRNFGDLTVGLNALVESGLQAVEVFRVDCHESKAQYVGQGRSAFIDNEFRERRDVWRAGVPALDVDVAIDVLSEP